MTETFKRSCTCGCLNPIEMIDRVALTADLRGKRTDNSLSAMKLEIDDLRARLEKVEKKRTEPTMNQTEKFYGERALLKKPGTRVEITDEMVERGAREVRILFGYRSPDTAMPDTAMYVARVILKAALNG